MTNQHPLTPPPELIKQWVSESNHNDPLFAQVAVMAASWGADQELEACIELLKADGYNGKAIDLRAARRPKPPSLKEQAFSELEILRIDANAHGLGFDAPAIRRALEALPND